MDDAGRSARTAALDHGHAMEPYARLLPAYIRERPRQLPHPHEGWARPHLQVDPSAPPV
jgi:hypothetical protein